MPKSSPFFYLQILQTYNELWCIYSALYLVYIPLQAESIFCNRVTLSSVNSILKGKGTCIVQFSRQTYRHQFKANPGVIANASLYNGTCPQFDSGLRASTFHPFWVDEIRTKLDWEVTIQSLATFHHSLNSAWSECDSDSLYLILKDNYNT